MSCILIVGLGSIGRRHLGNLRTLAYPDVVLCRTGKGPSGAAPIEGYRNERSLAAALSHRPIATIVANPTSLHVETAILAAEAGSHLLIEKPVSHSEEGLDRLAAVVEARALKVLVGFQFRFHPGLLAVKRMLEEERIGPVRSVHAHWGEYLPDWHPGEDYRQGYSARADLGGGVLLTLCHPFDYLRWLLGEVRTVAASTSHDGLNLDVEDTADVILSFESGVTGTVHLDYVQRPPSHWLRLTGELGTILWDNADGAVRVWHAETREWETIPPPAGFERNTMFLAEMRHFLECVEGKVEPRVTLTDGVRALQIALAAKRAAAEGRTIEVGHA